MVGRMVVRLGGIVSREGSRWAGDRATVPLSSATVLALTTAVLIAALPLSSALLSFFVVDQVQRGGSPATASPAIPSVADYPSRKTMEAKLQEKRFPKSGQVGKRDNRKGCTGPKSDLKKSCAQENTEKRTVEIMRSERRGQGDLTWDSVKIVDELDLADEVDTGKTRIHLLPDGRQVSTFLNRGMNGRFLVLNSRENGSLSLVITSCTSILVGSINFLSGSSQGMLPKMYVAFKRSQLLESFRTQRTLSYKMRVTDRGVYSLELRPIYSNTYVHLFATTDPGHIDPFDPSEPQTSLSSTSGKLHIYNFLNFHNTHPRPWVGVKRLRGGRVQVKWDPSPVNPHRMHYCIVFNTRRDYASLCGAQGDKYGYLPPDLTHLPIYPFYPPENDPGDPGAGDRARQNAENEVRTKSVSDDIIVGCLRRKTSYILTDLQEGRIYYFNVFVKDIVTGLSFPYVRTMLRYQIPKRNENVIRDATPVNVPLGPDAVTLEFKIKKSCSELSVYVMPCGGGSIAYQLLLTNRTLYEASNVDSLDIVKMAFPIRAKYYIKIGQAALQEDQVKARMAQVFVSKRQKKFPLPKLPVIPTVTELTSERGCDTVTIEWSPSPDIRDNEYCLFLKELEPGGDFQYFKKPNQCDVERNLQSDPYVSYSYCVQKIILPERKFLRERVVGLKPSTTYSLQMIVKRHNGKAALSYDLTRVSTTQKCVNE